MPVISTSIEIKPKTDIPDGKKVFHLYCPGVLYNQNEDSTDPFYLTNIEATEVVSPGEFSLNFLSEIQVILMFKI